MTSIQLPAVAAVLDVGIKNSNSGPKKETLNFIEYCHHLFLCISKTNHASRMQKVELFPWTNDLVDTSSIALAAFYVGVFWQRQQIIICKANHPWEITNLLPYRFTLSMRLHGCKDGYSSEDSSLIWFNTTCYKERYRSNKYDRPCVFIRAGYLMHSRQPQSAPVHLHCSSLLKEQRYII